MKKTSSIYRLLLACVAAIGAGFLRLTGHTPLANTITATAYTDGVKTFSATAALTKFHIVKFGSAETECTTCTSSDVPIGVVTAAHDSGDLVAVRLLGAAPGTEIGIADAAIAKGEHLVPGSSTSGRIRKLPSSTGNYYIIGRALTAAAAAGDEFEYVPCMPYLIAVA